MKNTEINYTIELLRRDKNQRKNIISMLQNFKKNYNIAGCSILELGCGLAQNLEIFKQDNTVTGIEGLLDVVEEARSTGLNIIHQDLDLEPICMPNSSQDFILCLDVLEHLLNPLKLLIEIKRLLNNRGCAILNVPNHMVWKGRIKILFGSGLDVHNYFPDCDDWNNPHIRFFTYEGFLRMIEKAELEIVEDWSSKCNNAIPFAGKIKNKYILNSLNMLASSNPSLLTAAFTLIVRKKQFQ
jgi:SAM-dependent methyltransferase